MSPTPKEVRALRLDVVREAKKAVRWYCDPVRTPIRGMWKWHEYKAEVRLIRNLILRDLARLEYELRHGIGRRMPKKRRAR